MMYNPLYSLIYLFALHNYLNSGRYAGRANKLYNRVVRKGRGGAIVKTHTNGQRLLCDFSHKLPFYQKAFPLYDRQLAKLCGFLHEKYGHALNIIDVGANVGDTVLNIGLKDAFYLCVEGNDYYSKFIKRNLRHYQYAIEKCYLTDTSDSVSYSVETANGTAHLVSAVDGGNVSMTTLDVVVKEKYGDVQFDLLKVDTDGFDFQVLRGSSQLLEKNKPLVFFEWDRELWESQGEKPMGVMTFLVRLGYTKCILFDNFGNYFDTTYISNTELLSKYIQNTHGEGLPYYYDVLAIHDTMDSELQQRLMNLFKTRT